MFSARDSSDIDRFFRGLAEYAFHTQLGVVDPPLVDYMAVLLIRFLRLDIATASPGSGRAGSPDVIRLLADVERHAPGAAREEYRQIGDVTLFWSGIYPEAVRWHRTPSREDWLAAYRDAGKRAYWLASTLEPEEAADQRLLLERLAHDFDLCVAGLREIRRAWQDAA